MQITGLHLVVAEGARPSLVEDQHVAVVLADVAGIVGGRCGGKPPVADWPVLFRAQNRVGRFWESVDLGLVENATEVQRICENITDSSSSPKSLIYLDN